MRRVYFWLLLVVACSDSQVVGVDARAAVVDGGGSDGSGGADAEGLDSGGGPVDGSARREDGGAGQPPDGSIDASAPLMDGSLGDSGPTDASIPDASTFDASTFDASTFDASTFDASTSDASTFDASTFDAGGFCGTAAFSGGPNSRAGRGQLNDIVPLTFVAGGTVFAIPNANLRTWYRWSGTDWMSEAVPTPLEGTQLVDWTMTVRGNVILLVSVGPARSFVRFDGTSTVEIPLIAALTGFNGVAAFTETAAGDVLALTRDRARGELHAFRGGAWQPPQTVPSMSRNASDTALAGLADGSLLLAWTNNTELRVSRRDPAGTWSPSERVNPGWRVTARNPKLHAPPSGGVVLGVTGHSRSYTVPSVLFSLDGVSFSPLEDVDDPLTPGGPVRSVYASECIEAPIVSTASGVWTRRGPDDWQRIAATAPTSSRVPVASGSAVALGSKAFWIWGEGIGPRVSFRLRGTL